MDKNLLGIMVWLFFLGGLFGFVVAITGYFAGSPPSVYGVMGIGGGFWLLSCAITIYIRSRLERG